MFRANLWAVLVTAASGCSGQGELEYYSATMVESTDVSDAPVHRKLFDEKNHTELGASWNTIDDSRVPSVAKTSFPTMDKPDVPAVTVVPVAPPLPPVLVENINVHIGDIHNHGDTFVSVKHIRETAGANSNHASHAQNAPSAEEDRFAVDERCEQLRREHEARVENWGRLFRED